MVGFNAVNSRKTTVHLFSVRTGGGEKLEAEVQPGGEEKCTAPEGETWVARDAGRIVAVYRATPRVARWTIARADTGFAVDLQAGDAGDYNESLVPNVRFLKPSGTIRAVMLFVKFADTTKPDADEHQVVARIVGTADAELRRVSFDEVGLNVTPVPGWRQLSKPASAYADSSCGCASSGLRPFLEEAVALYRSGVDFSQYEVVYVVAAESEDFRLSPAWVAERDGAIQTATGDTRYAVAFGEDSYDSDNATFLLLHETYHLMGLPDLYDGGEVAEKGHRRGFSNSGLSRWDLMASQRGDADLLGWHRLKLGWLHPSQVIGLYGYGSIEVDLADWTGPDGVKAVTVPVTRRADVADASMAYVAEVAAPRGAGVLVYSVNAALPTWERPVQMRSGPDALSNEPLTKGQSFTHLSGVTVTVVRRLNSGYRVRVEKG